MNRILSLIGVVLVMVVEVVGQEPRLISNLTVLDDDVTNGFLVGTVVNPVDRNPYSGPVFSVSPSGREINPYRHTIKIPDSWNSRFRNGLFNGPFEGYHDNGQLMMKWTFEEGELNGPFEMYYENGQLMEKGTWKDGKYDRLREWYWENGQLRERGVFKDGIWEGPFETYGENGQLLSKGTYTGGVNGKFDGSYWFYINSQYWSQGTYKDGVKCGEWIEGGETVTYDPC